MSYKAKEYWEERFKSGCSITSTGHSGFSRHYNRYMYKLRERVLEKALGRHHIKVAGQNILDIGCGSGYFVDFYKRKGAGAVTGIDITDASIHAMHERFPDYSFLKIDIGLPHASFDRVFDIVNVFDVLYHIVDDNAFENAIANIGAWSKKGSWVFITDALDPSKNIAEHVRYRGPEIYAAALKKEEIDIVSIFPVFHLMGKGVSPVIRNETVRKISARAIELLAWLSYCIDVVHCPAERSTMRLLVCRKR